MRNSTLAVAAALSCAVATTPARAIYLTTAVTESSGAPLGLLFVGNDYNVIIDMAASPTAQFDYKISRTSLYDYYVNSAIDSTSFANVTSQFNKYKYVVTSPTELTISFEPDVVGTYSFNFKDLIVETRTQIAAEKKPISEDGYTSFFEKIVPPPLMQGPLSCGFDQSYGGAGFTTTAQCALTFTVAPKIVSVPSVPEPASWAMLLTGFGALGTTLRRRRDGAHRSLAPIRR
ncbi:PEPxxWA-CTERM sorting domain-containing protein [Sphingomonas bacterium]|uniref:PEPxxWA-CTERM sorting domain-containing protein n=1 Tax=Sphingomonas bacterium TaxID=1895847 RepID=UPI0015751071|nr:PEPxxWA-CTERM sorting domain-containing protein [Sphingomonas bacterium]